MTQKEDDDAKQGLKTALKLLGLLYAIALLQVLFSYLPRFL